MTGGFGTIQLVLYDAGYAGLVEDCLAARLEVVRQSHVAAFDVVDAVQLALNFIWL